MNEFHVNAVSVTAGGMPDWRTAQDILTGRERYQAEPLERYKPERLPPNEKRRATTLVHLAFRVCEEIVRGHPEAVQEALTVFASSGGDYQIIDQICRVLCEPQRALSPTQFHNSVHNAAAGYWSIATQSRQASTSLSCYDHSFAAGLMEAAAMVHESGRPVLLAVYDAKLPQPLLDKRCITFPFAVALLLSAHRTGDSPAKITLRQCKADKETGCDNPDLETLRTGNPAARALPLLEQLARRQPGTIELALPGGSALKLDTAFDFK